MQLLVSILHHNVASALGVNVALLLRLLILSYDADITSSD
jgi:hypothetical protein